MKRLMMFLLVLVGLLASHEAQAFYNPSTGRWLSRDPVTDRGFLRTQFREDPKSFPDLRFERRSPQYSFVLNRPLDHLDLLGLNVYKVELPSSVSGSVVNHRQVVGDDGKGGCYILEFYPRKNAGSCRCFGATLVGPGEVSVQRIKSQSADDYIKANGLKVVDTVETSDVEFYPSSRGSVDSNLAQDVGKEDKGKAPRYILLFNDCGSIANSWMKHARQLLKQAEDSIPDLSF